MTDDCNEGMVRAAENKAIELVRLIDLMQDEAVPEVERDRAAEAAEALVCGIGPDGEELLIFSHFLGVCVLQLSHGLTAGLNLSLGPRDYMEALREHARERRRKDPGENVRDGAGPHT